jgi:hypothetical protein
MLPGKRLKLATKSRGPTKSEPLTQKKNPTKSLKRVVEDCAFVGRLGWGGSRLNHLKGHDHTTHESPGVTERKRNRP